MARPRPPGSHLRLAITVIFFFFFAALRFPTPAAAQQPVVVPAAAAPRSEADVLIAFRDTLRGPDGPPTGPAPHGLQLERLGLAGAAPDIGALAVLPGLRALSLSDNALTGAFPNVSALAVLKMLYLSRNRIFPGPVPGSISSPRLLELSLANNRFEGPLPDFSQPELRFVDVSNNNLCGPIPTGLSRFNASMFTGNSLLCGKPLDVECDESGAPRTGMSKLMIIAIVIIILGVLLCAGGVITGVLGSRRGSSRRRRAPAESIGGGGDQTPSNPKLQTAPAVNIENAPAAGQPQPRAGGNAAGGRRPRRDELVFIINEGGGGNRSSILDWGKRLRIIKGAARGLAHLYDELPMLTVPHGHLKSSNVLLDAAFDPVLSDYALVPVVTPSIAAQVMVAYKSPECVAPHGKPSKKSDVWSLGVLILEVLTGKFPASYLAGGGGNIKQGRQQQNADLAGWVHSVVSEERTDEVFDKDITGARGAEADMVKLLQKIVWFSFKTNIL
ncbi:hypothetical protein PR202_gb06362 [Eleusine coracana subsp. coracana]|uniref:Protein kinase domain-containing protein n=1 Tax=Eleusine coracana subsp. coracana TaxID=191504 RepID=A0AAV5E6Y5_ELECO|nr:hypothetical protein PR202_gb06362 [Eleusine coracana subsp. coracana]